MISVYTDMGSVDDKTALAYVILDDESYIESDCIVVETTTRNSDVKELLAVHHALQRLQDIQPSDQDVVLFTDSDETIVTITRRTDIRNRRVREIRRIVREYGIRFQHIKAHQSKCTPNRLVDAMCTAKLKEVIQIEERSE